jgi:methionyl-tRNA formyltransferase
MIAHILTNDEYFDWVVGRIQPYLDQHSIFVSTQPRYMERYDVGISFMHLSKVPAEQVRSHKWFNFHPGLLPDYKGRNLCYHAIMNGEAEFGATLHLMDENFDTGAIVARWKFRVLDSHTAGDVSAKTILASKALFDDYLPRILDKENFLLLPNIGGTYYKKEPISDFIEISEEAKRRIRAVTYGDFHPVIDIGGATYKIVREE